MNNILASLLKPLHARVSLHFSLYCNCRFAGLSCPLDCMLLEGKHCVYLCVSITSVVPGTSHTHVPKAESQRRMRGDREREARRGGVG